jgi:hypothetical protein
MQLIGDHQLALRCVVCVDHRLAIGDAVGHRFFTQHVFTICRESCILVHAIGKHNVDDVDRRLFLSRFEFS